MRNKGFTYTVAAHPTAYCGITFRSRLEATWAAFFDICEWKWAYEPLDLPGWTPDFILFDQMAVEVKPLLNVDQAQGLPETMLASGWTGHLGILGVKPRCFGTDRETDIGWSLSSNPPFRYIGSQGNISLLSGPDTFDYSWDTDSGGGQCRDIIDDAWVRAINTTQWKGR